MYCKGNRFRTGQIRSCTHVFDHDNTILRWLAMFLVPATYRKDEVKVAGRKVVEDSGIYDTCFWGRTTGRSGGT